MASEPIPASDKPVVGGQVYGSAIPAISAPKVGWGEATALITGDQRREVSGSIDIFSPEALQWEDGDLLTLEMEDGVKVEFIFHKATPLGGDVRE